MRREHSLIAVTAAVALALTACGATAASGGQPPASPSTPAVTAPPCNPQSPAAQAPVGATQALSVIPVRVVSGVSITPAMVNLGTVGCVSVGVGQKVGIHVHARVPPWPAEAYSAPSHLSAITLTPAIPSPMTVPQAGEYTLRFTAESAGTSAIVYLAATCTLPPGFC